MWKKFYRLSARLSQIRTIIYIFCFKKTQTQTKKFPLANLFEQIYVFSLQKIKDRALCFSTKKSAVRAVFKHKLSLKNSIKFIKKKFFGCPGEGFFRYPHCRKQGYYYFWLDTRSKLQISNLLNFKLAIFFFEVPISLF